MKKLHLIFLTFLLVPALIACSGQNDNSLDNKEISNEEEEIPVNNDHATKKSEDGNTALQDEQTDMKNKMEALEFAEIEIDIDYPDRKEFDAEIEKDSSGNYKAKVEDEIHNNHLKGKDAFDYLYAILEDMNITNDISKNELITNMLEGFDLDNTYEELDIEITFHDGTKMEFEDRK